MAASQLGTLHALMWETPEPAILDQSGDSSRARSVDLEMLQKDARLRPGAGEVLYRLGLAYDASVATALSAVTVSQRAARARAAPSSAAISRWMRCSTSSSAPIEATVVSSRCPPKRESARPRSSTRSCGFSTIAARSRESAVAAVRSGSLARKRICRSWRCSTASSAARQHGSLSRLLRALAPSWYVQITPLAENDSSAARLAADVAIGSQERLKREIAALLEEVSRLHPVVLCFDDVHWADPSTTDLIGYLARRIDTMRLMIVATYRPSELAQTKHPFLPLKLDLVARGACREIAPGPLDEAAIGRYLALQFADHAFPRGFAALIHQRTEGHPLFVVDLLRDLRRRQVLRQQDGKWIIGEELSSLEKALPESVRSHGPAQDRRARRGRSPAARRRERAGNRLRFVDRRRRDRTRSGRRRGLPGEAGTRTRAGAASSRNMKPHNRELTLRYRFAHHIYHNAFDASLRATRRATLSRAIAQRLIARLGGQPCDCAADIALLLESARDNVRAAEYWNQAAQASARLYAHDETERLALRGLKLLEGEPDSVQKATAELGLQMTYGLCMKTSRGYAVAEVGRAYARARELCRQIDDPARVVPVLIGLSAPTTSSRAKS